MRRYTDPQCTEPPEYQIGDLVMLNGRNICQNIRVIGCLGTPLLDHFTIARTPLYIYMQKKAHYPSPTRPDALGSNLSPPV